MLAGSDADIVDLRRKDNTSRFADPPSTVIVRPANRPLSGLLLFL